MEWSDLYPRLSTQLMFFLFFTILISISIGYYTWKNHTFDFVHYDYKVKHIFVLKKALRILIVLLFVDVFYCGYIPLLTPIIDSKNNYLNYGMPTVHVVVVIGFLLVFICSFWFYKCCSDKKNKKILLKLCALCTIQPLICYSRAQLLLMLSAAALIIIACSDNLKKHIMIVGIISAVSLYLFGVVGNLRHSSYGFSFAEIVRANQNFYRTGLSETYLWPYIYISSSLANVQNMIDTRGNVRPQAEGLDNFIINNLTVESIRKRLFKDASMESVAHNKNHLITTELTVGSIYYGAYGSYKWIGMFLIFFYYLLIILLFIHIMPRKSIFKLPLIVCLVLMTLMSTFANPFSQDYMIFPLIFFIGIARFNKYKLTK